MVKISVILPVYNEEFYLKQCLDSICGQTLKDIEIICIDDGSEDESLAILRDYECRDQRVKVLTQKNQYAGVARNYGMKNATGKYLLFLDSDDYFQLDMLEKMYQSAEYNQLDITICHYDLYNDIRHEKTTTDFSVENSFLPPNKDVFSGREINFLGIFQLTVGWAWDKLFRRDFVKMCGYEFSDFRSSEDGFFVYMLMARAERIGVIQEPLVIHRMYNLNSLSNTMEQNWENGFKMLELIRSELLKQHLYDLYEQSFVSMAIRFQMYYLKSMFEKEAYYNCYQYIRTVIEPKFQLLMFKGEFLCSEIEVAQYRQILEQDAENFLFELLKEKENKMRRMGRKGWIFPYHLIPKGCKLVLYGAGAVGKEYYDQLRKTEYCNNVMWVDQKYQKYQKQNIPVENPEVIPDKNFDYILITIQNIEIQKSVSIWLQSIGVEQSKIICAG